MPDFSFDEARDVLAAVRLIAHDELRAPLSDADCLTLADAGIEVKDQLRGLIDFPTTVEGVAAYWCWQSGEPEIAWWHARDAGFAGRRPIEG